jgi:AraC-like DNA-binding protein
LGARRNVCTKASASLSAWATWPAKPEFIQSTWRASSARWSDELPGEYQQRLQVRAACELLRDPEWPLAAIAAECGFADQSHFTRVFRRMAGTTPARFRQAVGPRAKVRH